MKITLKRIALLLLVASLAFFAAACEEEEVPPNSAEDIVAASAEVPQASAERISETEDDVSHTLDISSISDRTNISISFSDYARNVSFADFISELQPALAAGDDKVIPYLLDLLSAYALNFSIEADIDGDNARIALAWQECGTDILTLYVFDERFYISTDFIDILSSIDLGEEAAAVFSAIDADYIRIDQNSLTDLFAILGIDPSELEGIDTDFSGMFNYDIEVLQAFSDRILAAMEEHASAIFPEEHFADAISISGNSYSISLNQDTALILAENLLDVYLDNQEEIIAFITELYIALGFEASDIAMITETLNSAEFTEENRQALRNFDLPAFNLDISFTATDEGMEQSISFVMPYRGDGFPSGTTTVEISSTTAALSSPVTAPSGNIKSIEEIVGSMFLNMMPNFAQGGGFDMSQFEDFDPSIFEDFDPAIFDAILGAA